jgi:hypothetical protein
VLPDTGFINLDTNATRLTAYLVHSFLAHCLGRVSIILPLTRIVRIELARM